MLYCIKHPYEPLYKVGFTSDVTRRMSEYKSHGLSVRPCLVTKGTRQDEKNVHSLLEGSRAYGEWFRCSKEAITLAMT